MSDNKQSKQSLDSEETSDSKRPAQGGPQLSSDHTEERSHRDRKFSSTSEFMEEGLINRAIHSGGLLRTQLTGSILVDIYDKGDKFLFDWKQEKPTVQKVSSDEADCKISLSDADFMKLLSGDLNPQIVLMSHKSKIHGKSGLAVYFFNLITPRSNH